MKIVSSRSGSGWVAIGCLTAAVLLPGCNSGDPVPKLKVDKTHLEIDPTPRGGENGEVLLEYSLSNQGRAPLVFKEIEPTCGCTRFWLEDEVIQPGKSTHFYARVSRGSLSRQVYFTLRSNDPIEPAVQLTALIKRIEEPPYVRADTSSVFFGTAARPGDSRDLMVYTCERPDAVSPWIREVVCDQPDVEIVPAGLDEKLSPNEELMGRTYRYDVRLASAFATGNFVRVLRLLDANNEQVGSVTATGSIVPAVVAIPPTVLIPAKRADLLERRIFIRAVQEHSLEVLVESELPQGIHIEPIETESKNRRDFVVRVQPEATLGNSFLLDFRTNHPEQPHVSVEFLEYGRKSD